MNPINKLDFPLGFKIYLILWLFDILLTRCQSFFFLLSTTTLLGRVTKIATIFLWNTTDSQPRLTNKLTRNWQSPQKENEQYNTILNITTNIQILFSGLGGRGCISHFYLWFCWVLLIYYLLLTSNLMVCNLTTRVT